MRLGFQPFAPTVDGGSWWTVSRWQKSSLLDKISENNQTLNYPKSYFA